jgi:four helix bundle suffix protein
MSDEEPLIPKHGGYRKLKSFQIARLVYDMTFRFCELYVDKRGRTHDQMVQAARSGVQNIAEGSMDSGTSKKTEIKLTNIARGSLEELRDDYEDYLRQRGLPEFAPDHPALVRFKKRRCSTLEEVQKWVADELKNHRTDLHGPTRTNTDTEHKRDQRMPSKPSPLDPKPSQIDPEPGLHNPKPSHHHSEPSQHEAALPPAPAGPCPSVTVRVGPCSSAPPSAILAANAALSLINLASYLLKRQVESQGDTFTEEGGFTERLYRIRSERRQKKRDK